MKNLLNIKTLIILFFAVVFLLGLSLYKDYGVYFDNTYQRINALLWYDYVKSFILEPSLSLADSLKYLLEKNDVQIINNSTLPSLQPTPLGIFCELFIDFFNIEGSKNIYQFRNLFNFFIYFLGLYFFCKLIHKRYKSHLYSFIGLLFLFLTPRFFAESFYNSQDIFFLTLVIINMYTGINFLEKPSLKRTLLFSLSSALALDTRIMAIIPILIILSFFFLKSLRSNLFLKKNLKYIFYFLPSTFFLVLVFWPYLWVNPISNFLYALSELSSPGFLFKIFYLGKYIISTNIPSHYHIVWIGVTTPIIIISLFLFGVFFLLRRTFIRLMKLNDDLNDLWRGDKEMLDIYFLILILFSLLLFMYKGLGYTGWRHLYFIYPSIIMISLHGFYYFHSIIKLKIFRIVVYSLIIFNLSYLIYWNYKFHPHQYVYFNLLFKKNFHKNFDMDYMGLSNKTAIEYIIHNNTNYPVKIGTISFSSLENQLHLIYV